MNLSAAEVDAGQQADRVAALVFPELPASHAEFSLRAASDRFLGGHKKNAHQSVSV
jgi:hypothetical protein